MEITEVRIKLMDDPQERLQAFCSITIDGAFVVRDLKIIKGTKGPFVAMPSRKLTDRCPRCGTKNNLRAVFCNQCGSKLHDDRASKGHDGRAKLYADIAHPINSECRDLIQKEVLEAYEQELILSREPGYICRYDDYGEESYGDSDLGDDECHMGGPPRGVTGAKTHEASHDGDGAMLTPAQRRIEPPASVPRKPHHSQEASREVSGAAAAGGATWRTRDEDDEFGAGVV
ncbi:Putative septation protein SpoVG [Maioricimonas rarisocia]|uniref:Septation protein SpoVG n=1 Tax=Maioricimonas rarisocia TaxID=2528026 RepID=A0A517Z8R9_9PLAN|nr:SpoVG family protein [Maioricimonas rarisocia]QDU38856.1 Putative septation protein SpoVG [Maioricimonas rarisocia]